jgi:hypothetical protein
MQQNIPQNNQNDQRQQGNQFQIPDDVQQDIDDAIDDMQSRQMDQIIGSIVSGLFTSRAIEDGQRLDAMARNALRRNRVRMCQWTPKRRTVTGRNYCPCPALTGSNYCGSHRSRCEREDRIRQLEEELQRRPYRDRQAIQPVQQILQAPQQEAEQPLERRPRGRPPKTRAQTVQQAREQPDVPRVEDVTKTTSLTSAMDTK